MALEINEQNFEQLVMQSTKPVVLDFWAVWCGPCKMVGPFIDEIAVEFADKAVVGKVDVDTSSSISVKYGVRNIPTILFIKDGNVVDKVVGAVPKSTLVEKLNSLL